MNLSKLVDIEIEGIDYNDYPDFCDAYVSYALVPRYDIIPQFLLDLLPSIMYRELTDNELDTVNENSDFVYELTIKKVY